MPEGTADEYDLPGIDTLLGTPNNPDPPKPAVSAEAGTVQPPAAERREPAAPLPPRDESGRFTKASPFTLRMAKELGMSDEDIAAVEDPKILEARVYERHVARSQRIEEVDRQNERIHTLANRPAAAAEAPGQPNGPTATQPVPIDLGIKSIDEDPENGRDPGIVGAFRKLAARVEEQDRTIAELRGHVMRQVAAQSDSEIDQGFSALGKDFDNLFGSGTGPELRTANPAAYRRRVSVINDLKANPPKNAGSIKAAVVTRAKELFGDVVKPVAATTATVEEPTAFTKDQWDQGGLNQPTARSTTADAPGVAKATRGVAERMRELAKANGTGKDDKFVP